MTKNYSIGWPVLAVIAVVAAGIGAGAVWLIKPAEAPTVPAEAEASAPADIEIKIPGEYLAAANIAVEPVAAGNVDGEILAPATVASQPNGEATIVARAAGTVIRVNRRIGDSVRAGDVLALVDSLDAASMAADRSVAMAKAELAKKTYARESSLFEQGVTPRQDMEAAQSALAVAEAEARRANAVARSAKVAGDGSVAVVSPIAGKITAETASLGAYVQPQAELFRVSGSGSVQIEAAVTAADAARIAAGDKATILVSGGQPVDAVVHSVTPTVNASTRSATVLLIPSVRAPNLVIGDGVQVRLHVKGSGDGMSVPEDAVQNIEGRDVLFVRTKEGFKAQPVLVGLRSGGVAQIVSGVSAGEQVATRNAFLIKADMIKSAKDE